MAVLHALPLTNVCSILVTKNSFKPVLSHIGGIDLSVNTHSELLAWSCNSQKEHKETYKSETSIEHYCKHMGVSNPSPLQHTTTFIVRKLVGIGRHDIALDRERRP